MRRLGVGTALAAVLLAGCGRSAHVSDAASAPLAAEVQQVRDLAATAQPDAVTAKLEEIRAAVDDFSRQGELTATGAARILEAVERVEQLLPLVPTTTTTTTRPHVDDDEEEEKEKDEDDEEKEEDD